MSIFPGASVTKFSARLLNGAPLNVSLWIAAAEDPRTVFAKAIEAFQYLADGLLQKEAGARNMPRHLAGPMQTDVSIPSLKQ